jgi:hypothetical protein
LGIFYFYFQTEALIAPQIYLTDLKLIKNSFNPGEKIEGNVTLWNYEKFMVTDLVFHFQILGEVVNGVPTQMIDEKVGQEIFSLLPGQKITKSFTYDLPTNLPAGEVLFRVQLATSRGEKMGWVEKVINIGGEGKFLFLNNYWLVKDGEKLHPGAGFEYQPGETPQIEFDIINNTNFTIVAFPKITTYKRNVGAEIVDTKKESDIILSPKEKKTIKTNLPQLYAPESYLSEVKMYSKESGEAISNVIYFRWVIGGEVAKILWIGLDKNIYQAGEEAEVKVQFTGPPHGDEPKAKEGELTVKLYNQEGKLIGEGKRTIKLRSGTTLVRIPIKENVTNPKIEVLISKGEKILDQHEVSQYGFRQYEFKIKPEGATITTGGITTTKEEIIKPEGKITAFEKITAFFEKNKRTIIFSVIIVSLIAIIYFLK